jgi:ferric iron reductase protein FhuF
MTFLEAEEWDILATQCRLSTFSNRDPIFSVIGSDLLDKDRCKELLRQLTPVMGSPSIAVTASLLSKRIAFLTTANCLYSMSVFNKGLNFSLDNCVIEYGYFNSVWHSRMPLIDLSVSTLQCETREDWRKDICHRLFADNLAHLWSMLVEVSGVSAAILWENTAVRVYGLYEHRLTEAQAATGIYSLEQQKNIEGDFRYLIQQAPGELFLQKRNPLKQYFKKLQTVDKKLIRFRRTCCFYHKATSPQKHCSNCPLIKPVKSKSVFSPEQM